MAAAICTLSSAPINADDGVAGEIAVYEAACTGDSAEGCYRYGGKLLTIALRGILARGADEVRLQELVNNGDFPNLTAAKIAARMPEHKTAYLIEQSFAYREKACLLGYTYACKELGVAYREGRQTGIDNARALTFLEKACAADTSYCSNRDEVLALVQPSAREPNYAEAEQSYESPIVNGCNEQDRRNAISAAKNLESSISFRVSRYEEKLSDLQKYNSTVSGSNYYQAEVNKLRSIKNGLVEDITAFLNTHGACISSNDYSGFESLRSSFQ